jgi:hypothetical protein
MACWNNVLAAAEAEQLAKLKEAISRLMEYDHANDSLAWELILQGASLEERDRFALVISAAQRQFLAGEVREPLNGAGWQVHWWNEYMRLMLPDGNYIDHFNTFKNGTMVITIKRSPRLAAIAKAEA